VTASISFNFDVNSQRLLRAIETEDDIGAVIRLHFEIDRAYEHVVKTLIPDVAQLKHRYMDERIRFLLAIGLPSIRVEPARVINGIRNKFAHDEKEAFSTADIERLSLAVEAMIGKQIPSNFALISKKQDSYREWRYGDMSLKEKFCFLGYLTLSGVATIENDFPKVSLV